MPTQSKTTNEQNRFLGVSTSKLKDAGLVDIKEKKLYIQVDHTNIMNAVFADSFLVSDGIPYIEAKFCSDYDEDTIKNFIDNTIRRYQENPAAHGGA